MTCHFCGICGWFVGFHMFKVEVWDWSMKNMTLCWPINQECLRGPIVSFIFVGYWMTQRSQHRTGEMDNQQVKTPFSLSRENYPDEMIHVGCGAAGTQNSFAWVLLSLHVFRWGVNEHQDHFKSETTLCFYVFSFSSKSMVETSSDWNPRSVRR